MLSDLIRDLRYALRMLAAAPTFTAVVVTPSPWVSAPTR